MKVRTRNAPSPTGIPHIGNSRTALFDYLLAKKYHGDFVLRIEDTDQKRLVKGAIEKIYAIHDFLGLVPDEDPRVGGSFGPYIQTQRLKLYQKYAQALVQSGAAYEKEGAIRFKMDTTGFSTWTDLVQGKLSIPNKMVDDKVLLKSDGVPTYHLASVVDDHLMEISHVFRGVEYISSTPLHLQLYQALGWQPPIFAHVSLLLGPDKSKLSKRHGAKSVLEYREEGYLAEAINNYLFYLGFSYKDNSDLLTLEQMVTIFDETKLQKQNAIFDLKKLIWFNGQHIRLKTDAELLALLKPFTQYHDKDLLTQIVPLVKTRIATLKDFDPLVKFFFETPTVPAELTNFQPFLKSALSVLETAAWNKEAIETGLVAIVDQNSYPKADFFMSLRLAVCGQKITPPLTESMLILSREAVVNRIKHALS